MLRNKWVIFPVVLFAFAMLASAQSQYTIDVFATLGPNYNGSPSYDAFASDLVAAVKAGNTSGGSGAGAFQSITSVTTSQPIVSSFESWQGTTPGIYPGELGTSLYFVLHIVTSDTLFSLSQVRYGEVRPDGTYDFSYDGANFAADLVGYNGATVYNSDQVGDDDTIPLTELIYVGEFVGWQPDPYTGNNQADLNAVKATLVGFIGQSITGTYSLWTTGVAAAPQLLASDSASVQIEADTSGIPEPGTIALAGLGLAALFLARRQR